jgi:hypothetical protein
MKWIKANELMPEMFDQSDLHYRVDGKKTDGVFLSEDVFEYRFAGRNICLEREDFHRIEWLDESPSADQAGEDEKSKEMLKAAMALVRTGWQMACDELLTFCNERKVSPDFMNQIVEMMDATKKREFNWEKFNEEAEKIGIKPTTH